MTHYSEALASITFLNMSGDVTLTWDKDSEAAILELVEEKMKQGYSFFILQPRKLGFIPLPAKRVPITSIEQTRAAGTVSMSDDNVRRVLDKAKVDDPALERVLATGKARLTLVPKSGSHDTVARAETAADVLKQRTIAVRPIVGG